MLIQAEYEALLRVADEVELAVQGSSRARSRDGAPHRVDPAASLIRMVIAPWLLAFGPTVSLSRRHHQFINSAARTGQRPPQPYSLESVPSRTLAAHRIARSASRK